MRWAAAALPVLLAACSAEREPEAAPSPTPTLGSARPVGPTSRH